MTWYVQITNAELIAILQAIILVVNISNKKKIVIFSDSKEGCRELEEGHEDSYLISTIWKLIADMVNYEFAIQWVPAHCGVNRNEEADVEGRNGTLDENSLTYPLTFGDARIRT